jgi:hypothetical protein
MGAVRLVLKILTSRPRFEHRSSRSNFENSGSLPEARYYRLFLQLELGVARKILSAGSIQIKMGWVPGFSKADSAARQIEKTWVGEGRGRV